MATDVFSVEIIGGATAIVIVVTGIFVRLNRRTLTEKRTDLALAWR